LVRVPPRVVSVNKSEYDIVYLFDDGIAESVRPGQKREPVLAAWAFTAARANVLLHLMAGSKADAETASACLLLGHVFPRAYGASGIIKAIETCFPRSERQRCLAHHMRNLAAKVPEDLWPEFKARAVAAYQAPSRVTALDLASGLIKDYEAALPSADARYQDDFEAAIAHLRMPITHRRAIDHSPSTPVRRRAKAAEDHSQRLRREAGVEVDVRRHDTRRRALASDPDHRLRAMPNGRHQIGARSGIRGSQWPHVKPLANAPYGKLSSASRT
jgi:hypothetical protein